MGVLVTNRRHTLVVETEEKIALTTVSRIGATTPAAAAASPGFATIGGAFR
jgi:hypothetical protein